MITAAPNSIGRTWIVSYNFTIPALPNAKAEFGYAISLAIGQDENGKPVMFESGGVALSSSAVLAPPSISTTILDKGMHVEDFAGLGLSLGASIGGYGQGISAAEVYGSNSLHAGYSFGSGTGSAINLSAGWTKMDDLSGYLATNPGVAQAYKEINAALANLGTDPSAAIQAKANLSLIGAPIEAAIVKNIGGNAGFWSTFFHLDGASTPMRISESDGSSILNTFNSAGVLTASTRFDPAGHAYEYDVLENGRFAIYRMQADGSWKKLGVPTPGAAASATPSAQGGPEHVEIHDTPTYYEEDHFNGTHLTTTITEDRINGVHGYRYDGLDHHLIIDNWGPKFSYYREDTPGGDHILSQTDAVAGTIYRSESHDNRLERYVYSQNKDVTDTLSVTDGGTKAHTQVYATGRTISDTSQITRTTVGTGYQDREQALTHTETNDAGVVTANLSWWASTGNTKYFYTRDSFGNRTIQENTESGVMWHYDSLKANGDYDKLSLDLASGRGHRDILSNGTHDVTDFVTDARGGIGNTLERTLDTATGYHQHTVSQADGRPVMTENSDARAGTSYLAHFNGAGRMVSQDVVNTDHSEVHRTWGDDGNPLTDFEISATGAKLAVVWYPGTSHTHTSDSFSPAGLHLQHVEYAPNGSYLELDTLNFDHSGSALTFDGHGSITRSDAIHSDGSRTIQNFFPNSSQVQTIDTLDPMGHHTAHVAYNAFGQRIETDAYRPDTDTLVTQDVRDPATGSDHVFAFTDGHLTGVTLNYVSGASFTFATAKTPSGTSLVAPIKPASFDALFHAEAKYLDAFDGHQDGVITLAPDFKVSATNPAILTTIDSHVAALDASQGRSLHDQHLAATQDLVASYLKAALVHEYLA